MTVTNTDQPILFAPSALLEEGWRDNVAISVDGTGNISSVVSDARFEPTTMRELSGPLFAGIPNLHSHAHQRAMAGLSEYRASSHGEQDSFWTWRKVMHAFAPMLTPETLEVIATQLYIEMLQAGYTSVCEFHYLHHDTDGSPFNVPAEMSEAIARAARTAGIGLTLLPVLYSRGGYAGREPNEGQRRFICAPEDFCAIFDSLQSSLSGNQNVRVGIAPHSPRQVSRDAMAAVIAHTKSRDPDAPIHIHVAEQTNDVEESIAHDGLRPVEWVLEYFDVDASWCLVHATHLSETEIRGVAKSGAVVGICPTTEANLGDGIFALLPFLEAGGRFGIGSDSNVSISPVEELRWLEYAQRLTHKRRNLVADGHGSSTGSRLFREACHGGAQASGRSIGRIAVGQRADLIVLDGETPWLAGRRKERLIDSFIFAGNESAVRDVWVGGKQVVSEGNHEAAEQSKHRYVGLMKTLEI